MTNLESLQTLVKGGDFSKVYDFCKKIKYNTPVEWVEELDDFWDGQWALMSLKSKFESCYNHGEATRTELERVTEIINRLL